jgi:hypothetical protein
MVVKEQNEPTKQTQRKIILKIKANVTLKREDIKERLSVLNYKKDQDVV